MLYIYYAVLFVAIVLGLLFGMALYRWFHYRDIYEVGELLIGEEDSPDWPYLSLSLDEEVKNFEGRQVLNAAGAQTGPDARKTWCLMEETLITL